MFCTLAEAIAFYTTGEKVRVRVIAANRSKGWKDETAEITFDDGSIAWIGRESNGRWDLLGSFSMSVTE